MRRPAALSMLMLLAACDGATGGTKVTRSSAASCLDGQPGVWQNVSPATFDFSAPPGQGNFGSCPALVLDPTDPATIYATFDGAGVWKTSDCGGSWARIDSASSGFTNGPGANCAWTMVIDPTNPKTLYANDGYGGGLGVFKSVNGGVDWTQGFGTTNLLPNHDSAKSVFVYGGFTGRIAMDPTNPSHLVTSPHFSCNSPHSAGCLLESKDGMDTWSVLENSLGAGGEGYTFGMVDSTHWLWSDPGSTGGLFRTEDAGVSWARVAGVDAAYADIYHASTGIYYMPAQNGLYKSTDAITWTRIDGSPGATLITGDGTTMFTTFGFPGFPPRYSTSPENDGETWTALPTDAAHGATDMKEGGGIVHADPVNHFLYSTNFGSGLWRMSTK